MNTNREKPISTQTRVAAAKNQVSCDLADEAVILNLTSGIYYGLNQVGGRIWQLIQEGCSVSDILEVLQREYDVEPERCARDVEILLREMAAKGLIVVQEGEKT